MQKHCTFAHPGSEPPQRIMAKRKTVDCSIHGVEDTVDCSTEGVEGVVDCSTERSKSYVIRKTPP